MINYQKDIIYYQGIVICTNDNIFYFDLNLIKKLLVKHFVNMIFNGSFYR